MSLYIMYCDHVGSLVPLIPPPTLANPIFPINPLLLSVFLLFFGLTDLIRVACVGMGRSYFSVPRQLTSTTPLKEMNNRLFWISIPTLMPTSTKLLNQIACFSLNYYIVRHLNKDKPNRWHWRATMCSHSWNKEMEYQDGKKRSCWLAHLYNAYLHWAGPRASSAAPKPGHLDFFLKVHFRLFRAKNFGIDPQQTSHCVRELLCKVVNGGRDAEEIAYAFSEAWILPTCDPVLLYSFLVI